MNDQGNLVCPLCGICHCCGQAHTQAASYLWLENCMPDMAKQVEQIDRANKAAASQIRLK